MAPVDIGHEEGEGKSCRTVLQGAFMQNVRQVECVHNSRNKVIHHSFRETTLITNSGCKIVGHRNFAFVSSSKLIDNFIFLFFSADKKIVCKSDFTNLMS